MTLNLVFHDISPSNFSSASKYTISLSQFREIADFFSKKLRDEHWYIKSVRFYFDDGYRSFLDYIFPLLQYYTNITFACAIPTGFINIAGYLSENDIFQLYKSGVVIVPHGVSHAALAIYQNEFLMQTTLGGEYINSEFGKQFVLSENQVLFQLQESKKRLEVLLKNSIDEFVLPYGLYNSQTLDINAAHAVYTYISTCDEYLDCGQKLRPRLLIDKDMNLSDIVDKVESLQEC